ncbi:hypothetical protein [Polynucleobacter sp. AP-Latsch-80-C2]|jgi:hypothetical protein|uniref:hypothetical protein n=1 Tax=Polynucleobacter sp. AP-Latsch-80-C2 TaxID=2576931 RepID=UPI001C0CEC1D|nr:hypothetical protein [Polynucleobacter sp. AP-Latsch-80-C2]MBU3623856.1 hypothetical protein [Polynucleobacter sp. AP-Latsch-80-C2]
MKLSQVQHLILSLFKKWVILATYFTLWFSALTFYNEAALHLEASRVIGYGVAIIQALLLSKFLVSAEYFQPVGSLYKSNIYLAAILRTTFDSIFVLISRIFSAGLEGTLKHQGFVESMLNFCQGDVLHILSLVCLYWLIVLPYVGYCLLEQIAGEQSVQSFLMSNRKSI